MLRALKLTVERWVGLRAEVLEGMKGLRKGEWKDVSRAGCLDYWMDAYEVGKERVGEHLGGDPSGGVLVVVLF